jgi:hypothetical protein
MLRLAALLTLIACDAGVKTKPAPAATDHKQSRAHTIPRNQLDMQGLPIPLPVHGLAVQTYGMGGYFDLEMLDTDAHTLRVISESWSQDKGHQRIDKSLALDAAELEKLGNLADGAWREEPKGRAPDVTDVRQDLFIVDKDDAFYLSNSLIGVTDEGERAWHPNASDLVREIETLAQPALEATDTAKKRHLHSISRDAIQTDSWAPMPKHGLMVRAWGLGGESVITIDSDAGTLQITRRTNSEHATDTTTKIEPAKIRSLMDLGVAAWDEEMQGVMHVAPDVREDLYVLDGDEAFYLSGHPITADGHPAAAKAVAAMFKLAR